MEIAGISNLCACATALLCLSNQAKRKVLLVCNGVWQRNEPTASKVAFFARVVRSQTFLLAQARINCKIVNNFAKFFRCLQNQTCNCALYVQNECYCFPTTHGAQAKMHKTAFRCLLFSLPKSLCQRQAFALPKLQKSCACLRCFAQIATFKCKKMKKCPRKAYFLQNWVLTNCIFGFII